MAMNDAGWIFLQKPLDFRKVAAHTELTRQRSETGAASSDAANLHAIDRRTCLTLVMLAVEGIYDDSIAGLHKTSSFFMNSRVRIVAVGHAHRDGGFVARA